MAIETAQQDPTQNSPEKAKKKEQVKENVKEQQKFGIEKELDDLNKDVLSNTNSQTEKKEKKESTVDKLNDFFTATGLDQERVMENNSNTLSEKQNLYNIRYNFVQYLHFLGFTLFPPSTIDINVAKSGKSYYERALAQGFKEAPMYKNGDTSYHGGAQQNEKLRNFIEENKDKAIINGIKLPGGKTLSQLTVPKGWK